MFDLIFVIICFLLWKINKNNAYILLGIGIIYGTVCLKFKLWEYSGYLRRISIFIYILFFIILNKQRRNK